MTPSVSGNRPVARLFRVAALAAASFAAIAAPGCGGAIGTNRPLLQETRAAQAGAPSTIVVPAAPSASPASTSTGAEPSRSTPADGVK
ncbi:MAG: hypothetical protein ACKOYN_12905 [Planctomycetota bacterium]